MDKDVVKLLIATEEHLSLLSQQLHEVRLIALATKDTLANLQPQGLEIYEAAYRDHLSAASQGLAALLRGHDETIRLLRTLL